MSDTPVAPPAPAGPTSADSTKSPAPQPAAPKPAKEVKPLTIRGVSFKSEDDAYAEIERGRQSTKLLTEAQKRLIEASKKEKDWEGLVGEVKTKKDARKVIERLGLSKDEAVEVFGRWLYENEVLPKELSPDQQRIRELEAKVKSKEDEEAKTKAEREAQEEEANTRREEARLRQELTKVIQDKKIPGTRLALRRMANYMAQYAEAGAEVPVERVADMVSEDYRQEFGELFDEATPDQLMEFFGEAKWRMLAKKVSEWALSRARPSGKVPEVQVKPRPPAEKEEKMNPQEFQRYLRSIK